MSRRERPASLVAERAVRYLTERARPVGSVELAGEVLATTVPDERTGRRVLETAFAGDARLVYQDGWRVREAPVPPLGPGPAPVEPELALILLEGSRPARGRPFQLTNLVAVRLNLGEIVHACGGVPLPGAAANDLRSATLQALDGAVPVLHDAPGALRALEVWLNEPLDRPISLRVLGSRRLGLPASHDLSALAARLGLTVRESSDLTDLPEILDACLARLRRSGESIHDLRGSPDAPPPIDWSKFGFDRRFLRDIPAAAGTYRFIDADGALVYVGKAKDLHRRVASYFREGAPRAKRVQRLLDVLHRIELEPSGSDLEALLREAAAIRKRNPSANIQRQLQLGGEHRKRLRSILVLEPAAAPHVLRAYLVRDGRLLGNIGIGPRGSGLKRVERILEDQYFGVPLGPSPAGGPEVQVEIVSRWLARNRERVVVFDPTDLGSAAEVIRRLRWFLERGSLREPDGTPILTR